ncbi:hypothetical protein ACFYXH_40555 [Streptomyces sp. NPDC002730]|uniref:hypothetical protein n=1 Tax=Streptomyces sp. NPDC002730 TaxID=3364662 RepID=UPI0036C2FEE0
MSCSRLKRDQRPCRHNVTDWPAYDDMPAPVVACWTHLTDPEREQCKAARERRSKESRQRYEQLRAERAARGEPEPQQVFREARPCSGQCITEADLWDQENPGRYYDHSDSKMVACARCDQHVCILCRDRNHSVGTSCTSQSAVPDDELLPEGDEEIDHGPNPREYLNHLVDQLARVTGERHATINARINRDIGVRSRVGAEEALIRRAAAVARDWLAAEEKGAPAETGRGT